MDVKSKTKRNNGHSIEWGNSTWDENEKSIRNRYDNTETGRFNKSGSGEIPWNDFKQMISESIKGNEFSNAELAEILKNISTKLGTL